FAIALGLNFAFVKGALGLWRRDEETAGLDSYKEEKRFFRLSLFYLFGLFVGLLLEVPLGYFGLS
ncbi:MAG: protoheme IX farnesyltransferase, partial [Alphaproteobacteria bacterium]|nr:protoheme IX farnesyltransferase [Alphaproteobacteria bacterium]